jgi:hypothetical protein
MALVRRVLGTALIAVVVVAIFGGGWLIGRLGIGSVIEPSSLPELERQFADQMRDVTLLGTFTIAGPEDRPARPDRYDIVNVEKVGENLWRFNASMECCGVSSAIPIVVPMRWHGDTPVIEMTDTSIPGVGSFTVRLLFHGDRYAGTWQHGSVGGLMSGRIQKRTDQTR